MVSIPTQVFSSIGWSGHDIKIPKKINNMLSLHHFICYTQDNKVHLILCHTKNALIFKMKFTLHCQPHICTFYNGFTESYYVVLQEYPSSSPSCHSVYTITWFAQHTLQFRWFVYRENTSLRFEEKNHIFLKSYTLVSLTHILNAPKIFFRHNIDENVYIHKYVHISLVSYKNLPFMRRK
jgi:hypothetical protein